MIDFNKMNLVFDRELPDYGDLIPIDDWKIEVDYGMFTDDDGNGHWVKDGKMTRGFGDNVCNLDCIEAAVEFGITHVMWFNK